MITLTFNGVDPSSVLGAGNFTINSIEGRGPVQRDLSLLTVPGRDGSYFQRARTPERTLEIGIVVRSGSITELRTQVDELNDLFVTDKVVPITFSDEDRTYYGILADGTNWDEIRTFGRGKLKFVCPDPFKYGDELSVNSTGDAIDIYSAGNEETEPVISFDVLEDTTVLMIADGDGNYNAIGKAYDLDQSTYVREQIILQDSMNTTTGWTTGTSVEGGSVAGAMSVSQNGQDFIASDYGTGTTWHGPALVKGLSEPLQDFRAEIFLNLFAYADPRTLGRVELYLLDVNGNTVARLAMSDPWEQNNHSIADIVLGGAGNPNRKFLVHTTGRTPIYWNKFTGGVLRLERIGNYFYAYVANRDGNLVHYREWGTGYTDAAGNHQTPISSVMVHIGAYGSSPTPTQTIQAVNVMKINDQPSDVPYIARAGDTVVFDHQTRDIRINGESRMEAKDFGGRFFKLKPGTTSLAMAPPGVADFTVNWRDKYK